MDPDYLKNALTKGQVEQNPIEQFKKWFDEAKNSNIDMYDAMVFSTADTSGKISSRVMLIKDVDAEGFVFYTNYHSSKGLLLEENPYAAINFYWKELERQVRITGTVQKVDDAVSDAYFSSRPKESQLAAWASKQSHSTGSRKDLEDAYKEMENKYPDNQLIPRPAHWGGYCLSPDRIEFWQGRPNRLHDRIEYLLEEGGKWKITRLNP